VPLNEFVDRAYQHKAAATDLDEPQFAVLDQLVESSSPPGMRSAQRPHRKHGDLTAWAGLTTWSMQARWLPIDPIGSAR
jgi:hypothetical protein